MNIALEAPASPDGAAPSAVRRLESPRIQSLTPLGSVVQREIGKVPAAAPVVTTAAPRTIIELATRAEWAHRSWITNNDVLLEILLGPLEANWFKAKECLTMDHWPESCTTQPSHDTGIRLMQALVTMRKAKWGNFITTIVKPQFEERMRMFGQVSGPLVDVSKRPGSAAVSTAVDPSAFAGDADLQADIDLQDERNADKSTGKNLQDIFDSVGAEAVTSDVDLASGGSNSELGVQFVNSRFRSHFAPGKMIPYDPGTVFDINVYASDWIHGEAGFTDSPEGKRTITPAAEIAKMSDDDQLKRTQRMEVWSLVKVRRNLSVPEWESYVAKTLASLTDEAAHAAMDTKLKAADTEFNNFETKVTARQAKMLASLTAQEAAFFGGRASAFGHGGDKDHHAQDASFTRAANAIYEETLQTVKELRVRIEKLVLAGPVENEAAISNLGVMLADKIAEALTYANEVYATEGAVQHTVLKQGAAKKLEKLRVDKKQTQLTSVDYDLKPDLYLQAVNENVGDSLHSIEHFKTFPRYAVYRAGKYLSRLCDATTLLLGSPDGKVPSFAPLLEIGTESVRVKKIKSGEIEGDPKFVDDDAFFAKYTASHLAEVRTMIIDFGAMVPKLAADKKASDEAAKAAAAQQAEATKLATAAAASDP